MNLHQAETVKPPVYGSQRTEILAERTIDFHREQKQEEQHPKLPEKQAPRLAAQDLIAPQQRQGAQQRTGRTEEFAEGRKLGETAKEKGGSHKDQQNQNHIFSVFQNPVKRQSFPLPEQGNFM